MQYFCNRLLLLSVLALAGVATMFCSAEEPCEVAAYYFPGYHSAPQLDARYGKGWNEWQLVRAAKPRFAGHVQPKVPVWGYEEESNPVAFARKIAAAADNGVTSFIFDWYWHDTGPFLERGLEQGFLQATNNNRIKFSLMWANHDWVELFPAKVGVKQELLHPGPVTRATFDLATDHIIKNYFSRTNYSRVDGKPYFSVYEMMTLIKGLGGVEKTREALDGFRQRTRAAGFPDLHLNAVVWGMQVPPNEPNIKTPADLAKVLGVDSVTSYCWIHHSGMEKFPATRYEDWAAQAEAVWPKLRDQYPVPYFPNVSMGWDSSPRTTQSDEFVNAGYPYTPVAIENTPDAFRKALQQAKEYVDKSGLKPRMITINAWNEWTEGSYLEPDTINGMKYLEAVKEVFPPKR
jgi:hypothetical protein